MLKGAAKPEVKDVLEEEARQAPDRPDPENRASRRYSEGNKNFARRAIERGWEFVTSPTTRTVGTLTVVSVGGGYSAARWVWANKDWLLNIFAESPRMTQTLH